MTTTIDLSAFGAGTYTFEDDGIAGNNRSQVRDQNGNIVATFDHTADAISVVSGAGQNIVLNFTDSLLGDFAIAPASNPDSIQVNRIETTGAVTLAATGAITEAGSDVDVDIVANLISLTSGTGVGAAGNAIETLAARISAGSVNGDIVLENFIAAMLGAKTQTSGNITFINHGTLTVGTPVPGMSGVLGDNVSLTTLGATADFLSSNRVDSRGTLTLITGRDFHPGTSMNSGGAIFAQTGRNHDGGLQNDGPGDVVIIAGGNFDGVASAIFGNSFVTAGGNVPGNIYAIRGNVTVNAGDNFTGTAEGLIVRITVDTDGTDPGVGGIVIDEDISGPGNSVPVIFLTGSGDNDNLIGTGYAEQIDGGAGADRMVGALGSDIYIVDDAGDQVVEGYVNGVNLGYDVVYAKVSYALAAGSTVESLVALDYAGTAPLALTGNDIANYLLGNAGDNQLNGGGGADLLEGRGGNDIYVVDNAGDLAIEYAGGGTNDAVYTLVSYTLTEGYAVESLVALDYAGTSALNLTGNSIANYLIGNDGANVLNGGAGSDALEGRAGADTFVFSTALGATNVDYLGDFSSVDDTINLDHNVFTGLGLGALNPGAFVTGTQAGDADDRIIYDQATGRLFFDADGAGGNAAVLFANLGGAPALSASDFVVV